jgi:hypothetical protein
MRRCLITLLLLLVCAAFTAACGASEPTVSRNPEVRLVVTLEPSAPRLEVTGSIKLPPSSEARETITLAVSEAMSGFKVDVESPGVSAGPAGLEKQPPRGTEARWIIKPAAPIPAGAAPVLRFSLTGGERRAAQFDITEASAIASGYGTNWYPQVEGDDDKCVGELEFRVPADYQVVATGARMAARQEERGVHRFRMENPTTICFAAGKYVVTEEAGRIPVSLYQLRKRDNAEAYVDGCRRVLDVLVREFGPYPYRRYALVEVPAEQASRAGFLGASVDGFIYVSSAMLDRPFAPWYFGHELSHQWWGNSVRVRGRRGEYLLSEGVAHYGALRTVEALEGRAAGEKFRRGGGDGGAMGFLRLAAAGLDERLDETRQTRMAWTKGFFALDMLAREVGVEAFRRALRSITRRHAFGRLSWEEFRREVEAASGKDLGGFFTQWFERRGAPEWSVTWEQEGRRVRGTVTQTGEPYPVKVEALLQGRDGETALRTMTIEGAATPFRWDVGFLVKSVQLDPRYLTLHWTPEYRGRAMANAPFERAQTAAIRGDMEGAEAVLLAALKEAPSPDVYGARSVAEYGMGRLRMVQRRWKEAAEHFRAALLAPNRDASAAAWVYRYLAEAARESGDLDTARWAVAASIAADAAGPDSGASEEAARLLLPAR